MCKYYLDDIATTKTRKTEHPPRQIMRGQLSSEMHNVPSIQATEFRQAIQNLPSGVAIVTTGTAVGRRGLTLSSVTSICMEPPCAAVGINASSETHDAIFARRSFGVSLLGGDQEDLAPRFGGREGVKSHQRFDIAPWSQGAPRRTASAKRTLRARVRFARSQGDWHAYHLCRTNYRDPASSWQSIDQLSGRASNLTA